MAAHAYHSGTHVGGTLQRRDRRRNAKEEDPGNHKPVRDNLEAVMWEKSSDPVPQYVRSVRIE